MRYPHYGYHHVLGEECHGTDRCSACNRSNRTSVIAFLSGSEYEPNRVRKLYINRRINERINERVVLCYVALLGLRVRW